MFKELFNGRAKVFACSALVLLVTACSSGNSDNTSQNSTSQSSTLLPLTQYGETTTIIAEHSGKCLDVRGGPNATQDGAIIEQWSCTGEANQDWNLNSKGNGNYELIARSSGKCIEPIGGGTANLTNIQQATCDGSSKQLWQLRAKSTAGRFEIINTNANRCLDVTGGPTATADGIYTELWDCTGEANQSWALTPPSSTPPTPEPEPLVAKHSNKCLSIQGGTTALQNGAIAEQMTCTANASHQAWSIKDLGNGYKELIVKHSGKCLEVRDSDPNNEAYIQQSTCTGAQNQLWQQEDMPSSGEYRFRTALAGNRCLDVRGGPNATQDGARMELWDCSGEANQTWTIGAPDPTDPTDPTNPTLVPFGQNAADYTFAWSDEFNGSDPALNPAIWNQRINTINGPDNFRVDGGMLKIWTQPNAAGYPYYDRNLTTVAGLDRRYGYYEIRAKLPVGDTVWPAFWTYQLSENSARRGEIDILEAYGMRYPNGPINELDNVIWIPCLSGESGCNQDGVRKIHERVAYPTNTNLSAGYNYYGLKWEPTRITFYFNGQEFSRKELTNASEAARINVPQAIVLSLQHFGPNGRGPSTGTTPQGIGNSFEIDYVRVWNLK